MIAKVERLKPKAKEQYSGFVRLSSVGVLTAPVGLLVDVNQGKATVDSSFIVIADITT